MRVPGEGWLMCGRRSPEAVGTVVKRVFWEHETFDLTSIHIHVT